MCINVCIILCMCACMCSEGEAYQIRLHVRKYANLRSSSTAFRISNKNKSLLEQYEKEKLLRNPVISDKNMKYISSLLRYSEAEKENKTLSTNLATSVPDPHKEILLTSTTNQLALSDAKRPLKEMLKRKIEGAYRSAKNAKLTFCNRNDSNVRNYASQEDISIPLTAINTVKKYIEKKAEFIVSQFDKSTESISSDFFPNDHNIYLVPVTSTYAHPPQSIPTITCRSMYYQIQPGANLTLPESYLTPDPSPIPSPRLENSLISISKSNKDKFGSTLPTEDVGLVETVKKLNILTSENMRNGDMSKTPVNASKQNISLSQPSSNSSKALPVFDAFDIEFFFDTINRGVTPCGVIPDADFKPETLVQEDEFRKFHKCVIPKTRNIIQGIEEINMSNVMISEDKWRDRSTNYMYPAQSNRFVGSSVAKTAFVNAKDSNILLHNLPNVRKEKLHCSHTVVESQLTGQKSINDFSALNCIDIADQLIESAKTFAKVNMNRDKHHVSNDTFTKSMSITKRGGIFEKCNSATVSHCCITTSKQSCDKELAASNSISEQFLVNNFKESCNVELNVFPKVNIVIEDTDCKQRKRTSNNSSTVEGQ